MLQFSGDRVILKTKKKKKKDMGNIMNAEA